MTRRAAQASEQADATGPNHVTAGRRQPAASRLLLATATFALLAPGHLRAQAMGATVSISGTVLENHDGCVRDGACFLKVRASGVVWQVIYHPGEGERRCARSDMADLGLALKSGDSITATGRHVPSAGLNLLDVCNSSADVLKLIRPK